MVKSNSVAYKHRGIWWEPITSIDKKEELQAHINQLRKRHHDYDIRKFGDLIQVSIPKDEYDRIEKRWKYFVNNNTNLSMKSLKEYGCIK